MGKINSNDSTDTDSTEYDDENCEDVLTCHVVNKVPQIKTYSTKNYENVSKRSVLMDNSYTDTEKNVIKNKTKQKEDVFISPKDLPEDVRQLLEIRHFSENRKKYITSSEDSLFDDTNHTTDYTNVTKGKQISNTCKISENKIKGVIISESINQDTETPFQFFNFDKKGKENVKTMNKNSSLLIENKSSSTLISDQNNDKNILLPIKKRKHEGKKGSEKIPSKKNKLDLKSDQNDKCSVSKIKAKQIELIKQNSFMYRDCEKNSEEFFQYSDQIRKKLFKSLPNKEALATVQNNLLQTPTQTEENNTGEENTHTSASISEVDSTKNQSWTNENILAKNPPYETNRINFNYTTDCMPKSSSSKRITTSENLTLLTSDITSSSKLLWCNRFTCAPKESHEQQSYQHQQPSPVSSSDVLGLPNPRFRVPPFNTKTPQPDRTHRSPSVESIPPSKPLSSDALKQIDFPTSEESKETAPKPPTSMKAPDPPSQIQDSPPKPMRTSSSKTVSFPPSPAALTIPIPEVPPSHSPKKSHSSSPKMPASPSSEAPSSKTATALKPTTSPVPDPPHRKPHKKLKSPSATVPPADPPPIPPTVITLTPVPMRAKRESHKKTKSPSATVPSADPPPVPPTAPITLTPAAEPAKRESRKKTKSPSATVPPKDPPPVPPTAPITLTPAPEPAKRESRKKTKSPSATVPPKDPPPVPPIAPITLIPAPEPARRESGKKIKSPSPSETPASPTAAKIPISSADEPTHQKPRKKSKSPSSSTPQTVPSPEPPPPTAPETKSRKSKEKLKSSSPTKPPVTETLPSQPSLKGKSPLVNVPTPVQPTTESAKGDDTLKEIPTTTEKIHDQIKPTHKGKTSNEIPHPEIFDSSLKHSKQSKPQKKEINNAEKNVDDTEEKKQKKASKPNKQVSNSIKDRFSKILPYLGNSIVKKKESDKQPPKLRVQFTDPRSNKKEFIDPEFLALYNPEIVRKAYKDQIAKLRDDGQYTDSEFDEMDDEIYEIILSYASRKKKNASDLSDISLDSKRSSMFEGFNFKDIFHAFRKQKLDQVTSESLQTLKRSKPYTVSLQPLPQLFTEPQKELKLPTNIEVTSEDVERTLMRDFSPERRAICDDRCFRIFTQPEPGFQITIPNTFYSVQEFILASGFDPEGPLITDQIIHAKFLMCIEVANMYHETLSMSRAGLLIHLAMTAPNSVQGFLRKLAEAVVNRRINSEAQINAFLNKIHQMAIGSETAIIKESSKVEQDNFRLIQRLKKKIFSEFYRKVGFWDIKNGEKEVTAKHLTLINIIPRLYKTGLYPFIDFVAEFIAFNKIMTTDQLEVALNRFLACSDGHITREEFSDWCYFGEKKKKK